MGRQSEKSSSASTLRTFLLATRSPSREASRINNNIILRLRAVIIHAASQDTRTVKTPDARASLEPV